MTERAAYSNEPTPAHECTVSRREHAGSAGILPAEARLSELENFRHDSSVSYSITTLRADALKRAGCLRSRR
jgi:hypothetical protein